MKVGTVSFWVKDDRRANIGETPDVAESFDVVLNGSVLAVLPRQASDSVAKRVRTVELAQAVLCLRIGGLKKPPNVLGHEIDKDFPWVQLQKRANPPK
jgi:hypothetical protein